MAFSQILAIRSWSIYLQQFLDQKPMHVNTKNTRDSGIQTYQIFSNDDEVCIPNLFSINENSHSFVQTLQVMHFSGACLVRRWTLLLDDNRKNLIKINSSFHHYLLSIMDWLCPGLCGQG